MLTLRNFVFSAALAVVGASAFAQTAPASAATPVFDQRQHNQDRRIDQGVASGALTTPEARRLDRQQDAIERAEDKAKADGVVTHRERKHLGKMQNHSSKAIYRQKHDAQRAP
jgi:hypothetical protein